MRFFLQFFIALIGIFILTRCGMTEYKPIERIQDQKEKFHAAIEDTTAKEFAGKNYQSLSYGEMKVYKPEAFVALDSVYSIKEEYLNNNDEAGLRKSGVEDLIPGYRAAAQEEVDKVRYEIEHIFQTENDTFIHIYHSFFLFNYKDSLLNITPFYDFKIIKNQKQSFYNYLFGYHFVDDRNLLISIDEQNFIRFYKQKEMQLIGTNQLEPFMSHVLNVMEVARGVHTVDFREIGRQMAFSYFKGNRKSQNVAIDKLGKLFEVKEDDIIQYYEVEIDWTNEDTNANYKTSFKFDPYLEILDVKTDNTKPNQKE